MLCAMSCINIYCIIVNITVLVYFTSDRKKARTSENPTATDMYENIEEATSNQIMEGRSYSIYLLMNKPCSS
jgi:hypothetical protein